MKKEKIQENWRIIPKNGNYLLSDLGHVRTIDGRSIETFNGCVYLGVERFEIADLIQKTFIRDDISTKSHTDVLNSPHLLKFTHFVQPPSTYPDVSFDSFKLWYVPEGFICCAPKRSFPQDKCKFVFLYEVGGNRCYMCRFDEVQPLKFRQTRNSGTVQISTNKTPVRFRSAIAIIYKEFNKAVKYHSRINDKTRLLKSYASNAVLNASGRLTPVSIYNNTIYVLYVDYKSLRAEYKELISQQDVMKLYEFVSLQSKTDWDRAFGFTKESFLNLIETADK